MWENKGKPTTYRGLIVTNVLIQKINGADWWHVPPRDPLAYKKRGKFLASTYLQAEFYGKPNINPEKVNIKNPIFGFSEHEILQKVFGSKGSKYLSEVNNPVNDFFERRISLDAIMYKKAKSLKYDSIILMTKTGEKALRKGRKPNSIELNLINI